VCWHSLLLLAMRGARSCRAFWRRRASCWARAGDAGPRAPRPVNTSDQLAFAALAVPPLLAAMGYVQANGGWKLRNGARNFY